MQMQVEAGNSCTIIYLFSLGQEFEGKMMQSMVLHFLLSYRSAVVCLFALVIISIYSREALQASVYLGTDRIRSLSALALAPSLLCAPHIPSFNTKPPSESKSQNQSILLPFLCLHPSNTSSSSSSLFSSSRSHPPPAQPSQIRNPSAYSDPTGDNRLPLVVYPIMATPHPPPASSPPSSF